MQCHNTHRPMLRSRLLLSCCMSLHFSVAESISAAGIESNSKSTIRLVRYGRPMSQFVDNVTIDFHTSMKANTKPSQLHMVT